MPDTKPRHERIAEQRAESKRILEDAALRLIEILNQRHADIPQFDDSLLADAAYILGLEGDGDDDEEEPDHG